MVLLTRLESRGHEARSRNYLSPMRLRTIVAPSSFGLFTPCLLLSSFSSSHARSSIRLIAAPIFAQPRFNPTGLGRVFLDSLLNHGYTRAF